MDSVYHKNGCRRRGINVGVPINEKENEKEEVISSENSGSEKYFCKGNLMGHIIYCGKNLD